jgi:hypothetical protein
VAEPPDPELEPILARFAAEGIDAAMLARVLALPVGENDKAVDADEGPSLPAPLGSLPAWWGPVIDDEGRRKLETLELDLVEPALEYGHDDDALIEFTRTQLPQQRYLVLESLGVRRWSAVYVALDMMNGRIVVLKISRRETDREGRDVIQITHRNVVIVHDTIVHAGYPTFVLEWCSQGTLADFARHSSDHRRVLACLIDGGRGLAFCHERGLVHGDVKPSNFLVSEDTGKLSDLGIARPPTLEGPEWGTVAFLPPERLAGVWSFAGDVFSFGLVIEHCMRGFAEVAGEFSTLVDKCTADDETARPSMREVLDELQAIAKAIDGEREQLEQLREREAIEKARAAVESEREAVASEREAIASEREAVAESQRRLDQAMLEAGKRTTITRGGIAAVVVAVALLVAGSVGVGAAMVERREQPDPVGDALELAREEAEKADRVKAVQYLESAFGLGLLAEGEDKEAALQRVAAAAEQLGDEFDEFGDFQAADDSWHVAHECFIELGDDAGRLRVERKGATLGR